jgi:hypothetical protein
VLTAGQAVTAQSRNALLPRRGVDRLQMHGPCLTSEFPQKRWHFAGVSGGVQ